MNRQLFVARAVEDFLHHVVADVPDGLAQREFVMSRERFIVHRRNGAALHRPAAAFNRALLDAFIPVGNYFVLVDFEENAQTRAFRARAEGIVEGEHARREVVNADSVVGTGVFLRKGHILLAEIDDDKSAAVLGGCLDAVGQARHDLGLYHQTVDDDLDIVLFIFL